MFFRIGRTLPPAAAPIPMADILQALPACFQRSDEKRIFEDELKKAFSQQYCFLVSSGKAALVLILQALKALYPERNEVLIPAFTCYSVPAAIKKTGLRVKLCDMGKNSLDYDKEQLQKIMEKNKDKKSILCVIVTHLFGCPADYKGLKEIIGEDIPIVEDAAQAMGEESNGKKLGTQGDAGFFSLGRGKALSTMEGGVIITSRTDLGAMIGYLEDNVAGYSRIDTIKLLIKAVFITVLQKPMLFWLPKSLPFLGLGETIYDQNFSIKKISSFQRQLARNWRKRLDRHRQARIANISFWENRLPNKLMRICRNYAGSAMIRLPLLASSNKERNFLVELSEQAGLGIMPGYPTPINEIADIAGEFTGQNYPHARNICDCLFTVPVHEFVRVEDNRQIMKLLKKGICRVFY